MSNIDYRLHAKFSKPDWANLWFSEEFLTSMYNCLKPEEDSKMSEINWKDAPEWANWVAMDGDGAWWWFESEPYLDPTWALSKLGNRCMEVRGVAGSYTGVVPENSLEQRPNRTLEDLIEDEDPEIVDAALGAMQRMIDEDRQRDNDFLEDSDDLDDLDDDIEEIDMLADVEINENLLRAAQRYQRDVVNSPSHYTDGRQYEVIDVIEDAVARASDPVGAALQAQVLKYILRMWDKDNPRTDAEKCRWYLDRLISKLEDK